MASDTSGKIFRTEILQRLDRLEANSNFHSSQLKAIATSQNIIINALKKQGLLSSAGVAQGGRPAGG
jgi:hypothetical protein